jgi:hypothetical protein
MSNKLLNFDSFVKGPKLEDPKTALDVKSASPVKKEKSIDQVKRASLSTGIKSTEPDYTKTKSAPIQEASSDTQAEIDAINATRELRKELATADTDDKRLAILNRIKQVQTQIEQKTKASKPI